MQSINVTNNFKYSQILKAVLETTQKFMLMFHAIIFPGNEMALTLTAKAFCALEYAKPVE